MSCPQLTDFANLGIFASQQDTGSDLIQTKEELEFITDRTLHSPKILNREMILKQYT
jgi:hypothetical protein